MEKNAQKDSNFELFRFLIKIEKTTLKFSDMESANIHFLDGHEKREEVEIEELPLEVEIEELPQVVGQIVKAPSKVKKSGSSENKVIYLGVFSTDRVV